jgi:hypothetical protein
MDDRSRRLQAEAATLLGLPSESSEVSEGPVARKGGQSDGVDRP